MERNITTLADTVELMTSSDWKERFVGEYYQTRLRIDGLAAMVKKYQDGTLDFEPNCPEGILTMQLSYMQSYLNVLRERAKIEDIEL